MNKVIKFLESKYLEDPIAHHAIQSMYCTPEEDVILGVIKLLFEKNKSLHQMILSHHLYCTTPMVIKDWTGK